MKPLFAVAAVGVAGFAIWKLATMFLLPVVGVVLSFLFKVALVIGLAWLALWFFRRNDNKGERGTGGETA
jgi:hypothetical protein